MTNSWAPPNPTYGGSEPSIRYSPYTVALAWVCKATLISPYVSLSLSAVLSTVLLCTAVYLFLKAYGREAAAPYVLLVMVSLWGGPPGYANSFALQDLPWHQVNPSALSFAIVIIVWAAFRWTALLKVSPARIFLLALLLGLAGAFVMLTHAMTGVFMFLTLFILASLDDRSVRFRLIGAHLLGAALAFMLCVIWPWYDFLGAIGSNAENEYWFNPGILTLLLTRWAPPALLCALFTLPMRKDPLVRFCLAALAVMVVLGALQYVTKSPTLARQLLPGIVLAHLPVGVWLHEHRAFSLWSWPSRLKRAISTESSTSHPALCVAVSVLVVLSCLVPQLYAVAKQPHLGRVYVAGLLGKEPKYLPSCQVYGKLLKEVGPGDIVLSDPQTMWPVPSFNGYVVAALHFEFFVPNQLERMRDSKLFFTTSDSQVLLELLDKYDVDWVILNEITMDNHQIGRLRFDDAVSAIEAHLTLLDAQALRRALSGSQRLR